SSLLVKSGCLVIAESGFEYGSNAFEAITFACKRVDDVDLHTGVPQVGQGAGRADVREDQVIVVPNSSGSLGRQIRGAVGTNGGHKSQGVALRRRASCRASEFPSRVPACSPLSLGRYTRWRRRVSRQAAPLVTSLPR